MKAVHTARRLCLAGGVLLALVGLGLTMVPARADTSAPPSTQFSAFAGTADAAGIMQTSDGQRPIEPTYQTFYGRAADGLSQYSAETFNARASIYYPGAAVIGLCTLALEAGAPVCPLPKYPLVATADGNTPDASVNSPAPSGGAGLPLGFGAGNADAHADQIKGVSTNAVTTNYDTPQGSGSVVHVGSVQSHTKQDVEVDPKTQASVLVDHAEASVSGIDILAGLIHIDSVFATSTTSDTGVAGGHKKVEDFQIHGVTAGGMPATIGANGVSVNGSGQGKPLIDTANQTVKGALGSSGITVRTIGVTKNSILDPRFCQGGEVDGLEITGNVPVSVPSNLPPSIEPTVGQLANTYYVDIVLGAVCTDGFAAAATAAPPAPTVTPPSVTPPVSGSTNTAAPSVSSTGPAFTSSAPIVPGTSGGLGLPITSTRAPLREAAPPRRISQTGLEASFGKGVAHGMDLLYLAFTLLFIGLLLGLRPLTPARLPSGR